VRVVQASTGPLDRSGTRRQVFAYDSVVTMQGGKGPQNEKRRGTVSMHKVEMTFRGYRLTTAEILYHMPDHPAVLQTFIWQELDLAPRFPILNRFLKFWQDNLEGKLHSVRVAARGLISATELRCAGSEFTLH